MTTRSFITAWIMKTASGCKIYIQLSPWLFYQHYIGDKKTEGVLSYFSKFLHQKKPQIVVQVP
jgi:hypothetical protein